MIVGVGNAFTVTVIVALFAHCPPDGVKVYVVVAKLLIAGDQVPDIPLVDVVGSEKLSLAHIGGSWLKIGGVGVIWLTITFDDCPWHPY